ncbi:MAG: M28 family metallopeptidase [Acidobacteria bacterium]|nr:M28 family metallopeptidase [Acidobacteriota bacterium]
MRSQVMVVLTCFAAASLAAGIAGESRPRPLRGFSPEAAKAQRQLEESFKAIPAAEEAKKQHRIFTAEPHPAGSARNNELARYVAERWKEWGWEEVTLHRYDVLVSSPREVSVEMVSPSYYRASLREDSYEVDSDTKNSNVSRGYLALSASGEVTAPVVYAHSGNPEDYEVLRRHGIDVRGKIVLVRYSNPYSYRGFKALTAQQEGAAAILIYSDPAEDGYVRGKVYPEGPWGPESHIQRGAITYDFMVAGDPLTPGWASLPEAKRIPREEAVSLPNIIAVPLSWRDAQPLLEYLDGPVAPKEWQGGLPLTYRLGGGAVRVRVKADMDTSLKPNYVVEARIRGSEFPDEWVVLGNHRDAWEFGGVDPSSGTASMMELARALGELKRGGIRSRRTLVLCSWDGEEVALTGSTEWGEQFADELKKKVVAYLNVDSSVSGPNFRASAVASLAPWLVEVSRGLEAPSGVTLHEEWKESLTRERHDQGRRGIVADSELVNTRIGSGSDHTVFLNHLGRPTIDLTFDGPYGVYHSMYDNFFWMNQFGDPGYRYHTLMAQLWGVAALRLANAEILPFDFAFYARQLRQFIRELPQGKQTPRQLDLQPVLKQVAELEAGGRRLNRAIERALASRGMTAALAEAVNRQLMQVEANWLHPDGIPGRPWFKHILYAARYTYAHLELPGLTEAIERGDCQTARAQARILQDALAKNVALLRRASTELEQAISREK